MHNISNFHSIENKKTIPEIRSSYNLEKDANNRRCAMNAFTNGRSYESMPEEDQTILSQIKWLTQEEANNILLPYLDQKYKNNHEEIDEAVNEMKTILDKQKNLIFESMERLTKYPILHQKFHLYYTTCARWPYNRKTWEIWMMSPLQKERREKLRTQAFAHELIHMQTHKYYELEYPMNQLDQQQFNMLKESLTFLLNIEFPWVNMAKDKWYPNHQEFRKVLEEYRLSCWDKKDFKDLIHFWCQYLINNMR